MKRTFSLLRYIFYSLNVTNVKTGIKSIVLAHGYSTASSMANVANRMLNKNVFKLMICL